MSAVKETVQPLYSVDLFAAKLERLHSEARVRLRLAVRDNASTKEEVALWKGIAEQLEIVGAMVREAR